jgi:cytochrome c oxidase subunit IV
MSQKDKNRPRREVRHVQGQSKGSGSQPRPPQGPVPRAPSSGHLQAVPAGAGTVALEESHHPGAAQYVQIAVVLVVITLIELGVYYIEALRPVLAPVLIVAAAAKFTLVVAFYMHLRFDSKVYRNLFLFGMVVAASIMVALLLLTSYHGVIPGGGAV